jgi:hypothetical protein
MEFVDAYRRNRNEQNIVAINENLIGSLLVKFFEGYRTKVDQDAKLEFSPDVLYRELVDLAEKNDIYLNPRHFPKIGDVLVKRLNTIRSNLKGGYGIAIDIERDVSNRSIIRIQSLKNGNGAERF